jgi:hypothetical protein
MSTKNKVAKKAQKFHLLAAPVFAGAMIAATVSGCGDDLIGGDNPLCCNEGDFQVGGTIEGDYSGEVKGALQAVADVSGIAAATIEDLTTACRAMATDLGAPAADRDAAEANTDKRARMKAYCNLAVSAVASLKGSGSITVDIQPPKCSASVSASASCSANCQVDASCDAKATPPTCEGGKLEVSCSGSCTAKAGAELNCTGSCSGSCSGKCTAEGGVACQGKCDGACSVATDEGGNCNGTCSGTCEVTAPNVECEGSCEGGCEGSCEASAGASVKCDGECAGEVEPLKCEGGTLKASCEADADCSANCDASVKAKAECTPPSIGVKITGIADANVSGKLKAVLEANLGLIATVKARFELAGEAVVTLSGNVNADFLVDIKLACIPVVVAAVIGAADDLSASGEASIQVLGSFG